VHIQIVNFNLSGMTEAEYGDACEQQFAALFRDVPGLAQKVWLSSPETNTYGGVYTWDSREAMLEFQTTPLFQAVISHPNLTNLRSTDFGILEAPTRVTRGLLETAVR